ncbi:DUF4089 domain-containing protein [Desulfuromonas acetoxidans]|nr:DUF4089 domain-containing protein [Desulfuromonas acetoxidans]NVD26171.1 DUF4089 domain-containing protein [Desulfuromonas acetoxidans]NVE18017.1 DUF4089 domain-containing protein [Desulfuromonas acetoxidans]
MGTLTTLRTVVRSFLNLRGYELPEIVTTDGAALMTQIAAIANSVAAE